MKTDITLINDQDDNLDFEAIIVIEKKMLKNNLIRRFNDFYTSRTKVTILDESEIPLASTTALLEAEKIKSVIYIGSTREHLFSNPILLSEKSSYFGTTNKVIGYQRHLSNSPLEQSFSIGLGELKKDIMKSELVLRNSNFVEVQLSLLKANEMNRNCQDSIHGLDSEEFCQLLKICGFSCKNNVMWFSDISEEPQYNEIDILCSSIWYYLEGLALRQNEDPSNKNDMTTLMVQAPDLSQDHEFIKSKETGRLWYKYKSSEINEEHHYLACSQEDYETTCQEGIPDRLLSI